MAADSRLSRARRLARGFLLGGGAALAASLAVVAVAVLAPVGAGRAATGRHRSDAAPNWSDSTAGLDSLLWKMAGKELVKPPQVHAAVKDSGLAGKLAKRLKLEGVVQADEGYSAYIRVDNKALETVRQGQKVLDFTVARIEPGAVTLSLEGVEVVVTH